MYMLTFETLRRSGRRAPRLPQKGETCFQIFWQLKLRIAKFRISFCTLLDAQKKKAQSTTSVFANAVYRYASYI